MSIFFISFSFICTAQSVITGQILDKEKNVIPGANVYLTENPKIGTSSDVNGCFKLKIPYPSCNITVSAIGFRSRVLTKESIAKLTKGLTSVEQVIILSVDNPSIPNVVVTAKREISKNGTSAYKIGEQAVKQIQAMSLGDILTLLPGNKQRMPSLCNVQQFNARASSSSVSDGARANALGASIIVDSRHISNDANMQAFNPAETLSGGKSTVGKGIDLRSISPASIESVEVILGVPSARYGNLSSGTVIVKNKVVPMQAVASLAVNKTNTQLNYIHGLKLGKNDILNYDISTSYSNESPIQKKDYYISGGTNLRWRHSAKNASHWVNTASISLSYAYNGQRFEKEDKYRDKHIFKNTSIAFSDYGSLDFLGTLDYNFSMSSDIQYSYMKEHNNDGPIPIAEGLETGTYTCAYSGFSYDVEKTIYGLPLFADGSVSTSQSVYYKKHVFNFETGVQFSYDKNLGKGLVNSSLPAGKTGSIGSRDAKFYKLPASFSWSLYHESTSAFNFLSNHNLRFTTGLRFDRMIRRYNLFQPRLSLNYKYRGVLNLRTAYGISCKAPSMIELYPGPTYLDIMNLGFFSENKAERIAVITTHKFMQENTRLKPSRGKTWEIGGDLKVSKIGNLHLTYYNKNLEKNILMAPELKILPFIKYEVVQRYPDRQPDVAPVDEGRQTQQIIYNMENNGQLESRGLEISLSLNEIPATHTRFDLTCSFNKTIESNTNKNLMYSKFILGNDVKRIGVYKNVNRQNLVGIGRFGVVQQIPKLSFVLNFSCELFFYSKDKFISPTIYPQGYYSLDGIYHSLDEIESQKEQNKDLWLDKWTFSKSYNPPFHYNLHLTIRKDIVGGHTVNFYVHNFLWYNPEYAYNNIRKKLNDEISFGFGISIRL